MSQHYCPVFLRYPGGKSKPQARDQIKAYFPESFGEYREPFVGGAGIFFSVDPAIPRWINDLNRPLVAVYEALKARPKEFIAACQAIAPATPDEPQVTVRSGKTHPKRLLELFDALLHDDTADAALRYLFLNRCAWNGRVMLEPDRRRRTVFTKPKGWSHGLLQRMAKAADVLRDATITNSDFKWLLDEPGNDVLVFCDPPYMKDTEYSKSGKLYEHGFTTEDHRRLRDAVARCPHRVVLSYDDHPRIRELYRKLYVHEASWTYMLRSDGRLGRELIITNYPALRTTVSLTGIAAPTQQLALPDPSENSLTEITGGMSVPTDITKLLIERRRKARYRSNHLKGEGTRRQQCVRDGYASAPRSWSLSLRRRDRWRLKSATPTPLIRFLDRCVGTPWNAVISEICTEAERRSLARVQIRQMLKRLVGPGSSRPFEVGADGNLRRRL